MGRTNRENIGWRVAIALTTLVAGDDLPEDCFLYGIA